jgi:anti-anti-sigma factor
VTAFPEEKRSTILPICVGFRSIVSFSQQPPVLRCSGDEDVATQGRRRSDCSKALAVKSDLRVDLTELSFADTSLMLDLAMIARRLRRAGCSMHVCGAQPQIMRLIHAVGLHRLPGVTVVGPAPDAVAALS